MHTSCHYTVIVHHYVTWFYLSINVCVHLQKLIVFTSVPMCSLVRLASGSPRSAGVLLTVTAT